MLVVYSRAQQTKSRMVTREQSLNKTGEVPCPHDTDSSSLNKNNIVGSADSQC